MKSLKVFQFCCFNFLLFYFTIESYLEVVNTEFHGLEVLKPALMIGRCKITLPMMRKILLICLTSSQMQELQFQWRGKHVRGSQVFFTKYVWIGGERPLTSNISTLLSSWTVQQYQIRQKEWHIISKIFASPYWLLVCSNQGYEQGAEPCF